MKKWWFKRRWRLVWVFMLVVQLGLIALYWVLASMGCFEQGC